MNRCLTTLPPWLPVAIVLLILGVNPAYGDLVTSVIAEHHPAGGGLFEYEYRLTNELGSDVPVGAFALDIPTTADLQSITGPAGWDIDYTPTSLSVTWVSSDPVFDLLPGSSLLFSFLSPLDADQRDYLVVGFGATDIFTNTGRVAGPSVAAVPEPSTIALLGIGALSLIGFTRRSRR